MSKVEIYTSPFCGFCHRAKHLLGQKNVTYDEVDVMMDRKRKREMVERAGGTHQRAADLHRWRTYRRVR